jgi:hypothetical protein
VSCVTRCGRQIEVETIDFPVKRRRERARQPFIITTRAQSNLLDKAEHLATAKIFRHLQFLAFKSWNKSEPVRLANAELARRGIDRKAKRLALRELEAFGLIKVTRQPRKSPEIVVLGGDHGPF